MDGHVHLKSRQLVMVVEGWMVGGVARWRDGWWRDGLLVGWEQSLHCYRHVTSFDRAIDL